ncbi:MAG: uncharacterized protein QOJ65_527 [Fimbriimonadaceae bacterium]|jgi:ankyrin repeat protein|nr:uncharacterized protein [Fimbriimonadaceae bacterium]
MLRESDFIEVVKAGDRTGVEHGLQTDPKLAAASSDGVSAVLLSVYYGHADIGRIIANAKGHLDIFEAAALGDEHAMAQFLTADPSVANTFSADGFTPLGLAAYFGHAEMVRQLLAAGADPNVASTNALGVLPLHSALSNGHKEIARALIEAGTKVNTPNKEGWMPLHYTAYSGDLETSDLLLANGASTSQVRNDGETPSMVARSRGHTGLADILA